MAGKTSTLTWTVPPDGGSPLSGYRVLVYEAGAVVSTLTSTTASVSVTASETLARTALIQAQNALGYSAPLAVTVPAASDSGGTPTPTPTPIVAPTITATAGDGTAYTVTATATADTRSATSNTATVTPVAANSTAPVLTASASGNAVLGTTATLTLASTATYTSTDLYRNGTLLKTAATFPYSDTGLTAGTFTYQVYAYNGAQLTKSSQAAVTVGSGAGTTATAGNYSMTTYTFNDPAEANNFQLDRSRADVTNGLLNVKVSSGQGLLGAAGTITRVGDTSTGVRMEVNGFVRSSYAAYGLLWAYSNENNFWFLDGATYGYYETGTRHEVATISGTQPQTLALELDADGTTRVYYGTTLKATFKTATRYDAFYGVWATTPFTVDTFKIGTLVAAPVTPIVAPTITGSRSGGAITVTQTQAGSGFTSSILYRDGVSAQNPASLPFTETSNAAHTYYVEVSANGTTQRSNTVSIAAYVAPTAQSNAIAYDFDNRSQIGLFNPFDSAALSINNGQLNAGRAAASTRSYTGAYTIIGQTTDNVRFEVTGFDGPNYAANNGGLIFAYGDVDHFWLMDGNFIGYYINGNYGAVGTSNPNREMAIEVDANGAVRLFYSVTEMTTPAFSFTMPAGTHFGSGYGFWGPGTTTQPLIAESARAILKTTPGTVRTQSWTFDTALEGDAWGTPFTQKQVSGGSLQGAVASPDYPGLYGDAILLVDSGSRTGTTTFTVNGYQPNSSSLGGLVWAYQDQSNFWAINGTGLGYYANGSWTGVATMPSYASSDMSLTITPANQLTISYSGSQVASLTMANRPGSRYGVWGPTSVALAGASISTTD